MNVLLLNFENFELVRSFRFWVIQFRVFWWRRTVRFVSIGISAAHVRGMDMVVES